MQKIVKKVVFNQNSCNFIYLLIIYDYIGVKYGEFP